METKRTATKRLWLMALAVTALAALAGPALALSDEEYRQLMKDPEFAAADKMLNEAWAAAQKSLSKPALEALKKDQRAWIAKGRDKEAGERDLPRAEAYAFVTEVRAELLPRLATQYDLMAKPKGPEGYYVRREGGHETGWLMIRWADTKKTSLVLDAEVILILDMGDGNKNNTRSGSFEGVAKLKGKRAEFSDAERPGSLILTFEGNSLRAEPTGEFNSSWGGLSVDFEGTYVRRRLK